MYIWHIKEPVQGTVFRKRELGSDWGSRCCVLLGPLGHRTGQASSGTGHNERVWPSGERHVLQVILLSMAFSRIISQVTCDAMQKCMSRPMKIWSEHSHWFSKIIKIHMHTSGHTNAGKHNRGKSVRNEWDKQSRGSWLALGWSKNKKD